MAHKDEMIATDIVGYLQAHEKKSLLRFITCGSVGDTKSTLIRPLPYPSKLLYHDQLPTLDADGRQVGNPGAPSRLDLLVHRAPA